MTRVAEEGWYCEGCGFFETDDPNGSSQCPSCGCSPDVHKEAKVVVQDD